MITRISSPAQWIPCGLYETRERERETETERQRDRERQRHRDTETQRHRDRERQRETERDDKMSLSDIMLYSYISRSMSYSNNHRDVSSFSR